MCGIFSLFLSRPLNDADIELGRAGVRALRHRGPNSEGEWIDRERGVYLGHCRLSIVDLSSASDQPMVRDDLVIAYNGEIYNHRSLRERLQSVGLKFSSTGDTEVLLRALQHFGPRALDEIDGMFAYALWDGRAGYLATDPFGEKQLYYATNRDGTYVSSELEPLARALKAQPDLSADTLAAYMALDYIPQPKTAFAGVKRLGPAAMIEIRNGRAGDSFRYWRPAKFLVHGGPIRELSERDLDAVHDILCESIEGRLIADAPMCVFLSSGVDSSLLVALAAREFDRPLDCITVSIAPGTPLDEAGLARETAEALGVSHTVIDGREGQAQGDAQFYLQMYGQPNGTLTVASVYQIAKAGAERGFRAGLTGMGGDEIFLGYLKNDFFFKHRGLYRQPEWLRRSLGSAMGPFAGVSRKISIFRDLVSVRDYERYLAKKNQPTISILRQIPGFSRWAEKVFGGATDPIELAVPYFEVSEGLANAHLTASDVGSMRASMELRTPFLNRRLQERMAEFDPRSLLAFGQKSVLRRLLRRYLPDRIVDRPKRGLVFPQDALLDTYGDTAPRVPGLSAELVDQFWRRRKERGFHRLAVRAILAEEFAVWAKAT